MGSSRSGCRALCFDSHHVALCQAPVVERSCPLPLRTAAMKLHRAVRDVLSPRGAPCPLEHVQVGRTDRIYLSSPQIEIQVGADLSSPQSLPHGVCRSSCCPMVQAMPQQENGHDCGIYVLAVANALCDWADMARQEGGGREGCMPRVSVITYTHTMISSWLGLFRCHVAL